MDVAEAPLNEASKAAVLDVKVWACTGSVAIKMPIKPKVRTTECIRETRKRRKIENGGETKRTNRIDKGKCHKNGHLIRSMYYLIRS